MITEAELDALDKAARHGLCVVWKNTTTRDEFIAEIRRQLDDKLRLIAALREARESNERLFQKLAHDCVIPVHLRSMSKEELAAFDAMREALDTCCHHYTCDAAPRHKDNTICYGCNINKAIAQADAVRPRAGKEGA